MQTVLSHTNQSFLGELTPSNQAGDWCSTCLFGFQGQEHDYEWTHHRGSHLNYKYRVHDARIGRFLSIDPLTKDYPWNSPYAFSENRVIDGIELEGLEHYFYWLVINESKISVDFGKTIGYHIKDGVSTPTSIGTVINSKSGVHIVPANPIQN